jgi:hypothetical protein
MTSDDRVKAVAEFGFTDRQARFLVTVMLHAGVCVPRQYARFSRIAYGHKVSRFFDRLVERGYATAFECRHNRAQLYHVKHHALYCAIDQPDSRYRRPVSGALALDRVMVLDGVLTSPELTWLATEEEKVAFMTLMVPSLPREPCRTSRLARTRRHASGSFQNSCRSESKRLAASCSSTSLPRLSMTTFARSPNGTRICWWPCPDGRFGCSSDRMPHASPRPPLQWRATSSRCALRRAPSPSSAGTSNSAGTRQTRGRERNWTNDFGWRAGPSRRVNAGGSTAAG